MCCRQPRADVAALRDRWPSHDDRDGNVAARGFDRMTPTLSRRVAAEGVGTAMLLAAVVGSGIMADRLSGGNQAIALLANTVATGAGLVALILTFGPVSGAHFNPAVSIADASQGGLSWADAGAYIVAQLLGAFLSVGLAHVMFGAPLYSWSTHARA